MKIVCDSCGAKYSIADEKVAGRVFKIRCKKCGAAIVVRGDQSASGSQESSAGGAPAATGFDYGGEAVWHVVVDGEQQGPFSPAQLGQMISANTIAWDAYVWREGYDDWKPAQDVEELVQAIMNPGGGASATSSEAGAAAADPFAAAPEPASAPPAASSDAGADLFAQSESASPFGGSSPFGSGADEDDVVASAPSPRVSASQAMTGARNENSVLFSLSNLQALATGGSSSTTSSSSSPALSVAAGKPAPAARPGMATGEGSGLIDIRALATATGVASPAASPGTAPAPSPARVDDLLSIGTASPGLGSALGAPVIIPEKKEESGGKGLMIGLSVLGVCILLAGGALAMVMSSQPDPATIATADTAAAGVIAPGAAAAPGTVTAPPEPAAAAPTAPAAPTGGTTVAAPTGGTTAPAAGEPEERGDSRGGGARRRDRDRPAAGGGGSSAPAAAAPAASSGGSSGGSSASSGGSRSGGGGGGGGGDIDALLEGALGGGGRRGGGGGGAAPAADSSLPQTPSRDDVMGAMSRVQGAVAACGGGQHGTAMVAISVAGTTGRVTSANVGGQFAGTPVGSCIARAVRGASFPRFQRASFTVNYPFRL